MSVFHFEHVNEVWISGILGVKGSVYSIDFKKRLPKNWVHVSKVGTLPSWRTSTQNMMKIPRD